MTGPVTVCVPTIPGREQMLSRAVTSVSGQTVPPAEVLILTDHERRGAAWARNTLLDQVTTEWVAFLDDDDELLPHHLAALTGHQQVTGADVVYPDAIRTYPGSPTLGEERWCRPFNPGAPPAVGGIPVTVLARTSVCRAARFGPAPDGTPYEDWGMFVRAHTSGARFAHACVPTWVWHVHPGSTGGT